MGILLKIFSERDKYQFWPCYHVFGFNFLGFFYSFDNIFLFFKENIMALLLYIRASNNFGEYDSKCWK